VFHWHVTNIVTVGKKTGETVGDYILLARNVFDVEVELLNLEFPTVNLLIDTLL
jgi:hypothetical protein